MNPALDARSSPKAEGRWRELFLGHVQIGERAFEGLGRERYRLRERGMRMDRQADVRAVGSHLDRERHLAHQVARVRADDAASEQAMGNRIEQQLGEAVVTPQ